MYFTGLQFQVLHHVLALLRLQEVRPSSEIVLWWALLLDRWQLFVLAEDSVFGTSFPYHLLSSRFIERISLFVYFQVGIRCKVATRGSYQMILWRLLSLLFLGKILTGVVKIAPWVLYSFEHIPTQFLTFLNRQFGLITLRTFGCRPWCNILIVSSFSWWLWSLTFLIKRDRLLFTPRRLGI